MILTQVSTAGDSTDTQRDRAQPPVCRISCQWSASLASSHEIWNPIHCHRRHHFRKAQSADCLM